MKTGTWICLGLVSLALLVLSNGVNAASGPEEYWTIEPGDYDDEIIPKDNDFQRVKITLTSSIPVDIYVLNFEQHSDLNSDGYVTSFEQEHKFEVTFEIEYIYPDDDPRWLVVINPSESETANVVIRNDLIIKGLDDDGTEEKDAPCGGLIWSGVITLVLFTAAILAIRKVQG